RAKRLMYESSRNVFGKKFGNLFIPFFCHRHSRLVFWHTSFLPLNKERYNFIFSSEERYLLKNNASPASPSSFLFFSKVMSAIPSRSFNVVFSFRNCSFSCCNNCNFLSKSSSGFEEEFIT